MATYERLDYGSDDGSQWGTVSTDKLGCYGVTPVVRYTAVGAASTYEGTVSTSSAIGTTFGFTAQGITSIILQVSTITVALRNFGIIV